LAFPGKTKAESKSAPLRAKGAAPGKGWEIDSIEAAEFEVRPEAKMQFFSGKRPKAWLLVAKRGE
jgi:hypothetical protein